MKVAHFIQSIDTSSGGPARSSTHLIDRIIEQSSFKVKLFTANSPNPIIKNFKCKGGDISFNKTGLLGSLKLSAESFNGFEIFHGHGIWQMPVHQMAKQARKLKKPYIISARGMLEPWSLSQSRIKKILALKLYQHKDLTLSSCIHATAKSEAENIRALGYNNPIAIIPNGINLEEFPIYKKKSNAKKKLLFLSRIHKKKGIENLISCWSELDNSLTKNWKVEIVGNGDARYIKQLEELIRTLKIEKSIKITGPVYGESKKNKYRQADLFVLPTFSENFGIVIAEALASCVPVITTKGAPWEELITYNCGDWIDIGKQPLQESLTKMLLKPDIELIQMGEKGRELIEKKYSIQSVATKINLVYEWLIGKKSKPNFVLMHHENS